VAATVLAGGVISGPAHADSSCTTTLCASASLYGIQDDWGQCAPYPGMPRWRICHYSWNYWASASSTLPGSIAWHTSTSLGPYEDDAKTWTTGGYSTGWRKIGTLPRGVQCGTTYTEFATVTVHAFDTLNPSGLHPWEYRTLDLVPGC
jgi:hypothetical protein